MSDTIDTGFVTIMNYGIMAVELIGALVIFFYTGKALIHLFRGKHDPCRDTLTDGISLGLSFLLGSEVLKTIIAPDWSDIGMTCAILVMRAGMTLLVHWENKMEHQAKHETEGTANATPKEPK